jgi:tripartite-type tricarboxylate transporter receptor subunit TctC
MLNRRQILVLPATLAATAPGWANDFPAAGRPIRFVVPVSAGTGTDLLTRHIANGLARVLRATTVVENRVGASGVIATEFVAKAPPDGYTLLATYATHYSTPWVMDKVPYEAVRDFTPIATLATSSLLMIVPANSPYRTARELIEAARGAPDKIAYATAGVGTMGHVSGSLLSASERITLRHVPYKSAAQPVQDVAGGQIEMSIAGTSSSVALVKAGRLRALATTGRVRSQILPDVPTLQEAGVKDFDVASPVWIMGPAGMPADVVNRLSASILEIARQPDFKELAIAQGLDVDLEDAATARAKAPAEFERWRRFIALTSAKTN